MSTISGSRSRADAKKPANAEKLIAHVPVAKHAPLFRYRSTLADRVGRVAWWLMSLRDHLLSELGPSSRRLWAGARTCRMQKNH